jgi:polyphenol oxidase
MPCSFQTHRCNHILLRSKNVRKPWHLSCKATGDRVVDRRDVLLGGAAAVAGLAAHHRGSALATPIQLPDLRNCHPVHNPDTPDHELIDCCPPFSTATEIIDFKLPSAGSPLRVRRAAHHMDGTEYLEKYKQAVKSMKLLPHDDPRSFEQQWRVHCAYCDGLYNQVGYSDLEIQIHNCWLFFPWHRYIHAMPASSLVLLIALVN